MLLSKRKIENGESPKPNLKLWDENFWKMTKSQRNHYNFTQGQIIELQRMRKFKTPKELGIMLGIGTHKVHQVLNNNPVMIHIEVKKKGIHPISKKVQRRINKINEGVEKRIREEAELQKMKENDINVLVVDSAVSANEESIPSGGQNGHKSSDNGVVGETANSETTDRNTVI
jgi:hypothetical protein